MKCQAARKRITDYIDGQLAPAVMERVEAHLAGCHACRRECDEIRATVRLVSQLGRLSCPADIRAAVLPRLRSAPARGTRFTWPSLSLALRAGVAATAAAGAVAAVVAALVFRPAEPSRTLVPVPPVASQRAPASAGAAAVDLPEWHDANRRQQALGTTDSLVLDISAVSGARLHSPR